MNATELTDAIRDARERTLELVADGVVERYV